MSRIIRSIINSATNRSTLQIIVFLNQNKFNNHIVDLPYKLIAFEKHSGDLNNKLTIINQEDITKCLGIIPDCILLDTLLKYQGAKSLAKILKCPLINIITEKEPIKKEASFQLASQQFDEDINFVSSEDLADNLFITNQIIITNLSTQLLELVNQWNST